MTEGEICAGRDLIAKLLLGKLPEGAGIPGPVAP